MPFHFPTIYYPTIFGGGDGGFDTGGANFDGTNDLVKTSGQFTGDADSKVIIFATRIRFSAAGDGVYQLLLWSPSGYLQMFKDASNIIKIAGLNSSAGLAFQVSSSRAITSADGFVNLIIAADTATSTAVMYIDDADVSTLKNVVLDTLVDYTRVGNWGFGARDAGADKMAADDRFVYLNTAETFDITDEDNRRKIFTASGAPAIDPTSDGSSVTGTAPILYLAGLHTEFHTNKGSGGGMIEVGELGPIV